MYISKVPNKSILTGVILTLTSLGHTANAAVVLINDSRTVSANASIYGPVGSDSASTSRNSLGDFADFDKSVNTDLSLEDVSLNGTAQQNSQISTTSITATGATTASAETTSFDPSFYTYADANGSADLYIDFQVDTPQLFDLSGILSASGFSGFSYGGAVVSLRSYDGSFQIFLETPYPDGQTPFDLSGTLYPNLYTLYAQASTTANAYGEEEAARGAADYSFDFNVAAVPIPTAAWLFGSGLLGLVGIARRKAA